MTHAFNVTHACFQLILTLKKEPLEAESGVESEGKTANSLVKATLFSDLDILSMIIACIGHDLDHPGLGNTYYQKSSEYRAQTVNNASILENYHTYVLLGLLNQSNVLAGLPNADNQYVRDLITHLILKTDMSQHFAL